MSGILTCIGGKGLAAAYIAKAVGGKEDAPAPSTVGDLYDFVEAAVSSIVGENVEEAQKANTEIRAQNVRQATKEIAEGIAGSGHSPEMQETHNALVAAGLAGGVFSATLNSLLKTTTPQPFPANNEAAKAKTEPPDTIGDLYDTANTTMGGLVATDPELAGEANRDMRSRNLEAFIKEGAEELAGKQEDPAMQELHEVLLGAGFVIGAFGATLNAAVHFVPFCGTKPPSA